MLVVMEMDGKIQLPLDYFWEGTVWEGTDNVTFKHANRAHEWKKGVPSNWILKFYCSRVVNCNLNHRLAPQPNCSVTGDFVASIQAHTHMYRAIR